MFRPEKKSAGTQEQSTPAKRRSKKQKIPKALREQVWVKQMGRTFEGKCPVSWCQNQITVFDFECGHNQPESKGGATTIDNLIPVCSRCNKSMSNTFTVSGWSSQYASKKRTWWHCFGQTTAIDPRMTAPTSSA